MLRTVAAGGYGIATRASVCGLTHTTMPVADDAKISSFRAAPNPGSQALCPDTMLAGQVNRLANARGVFCKAASMKLGSARQIAKCSKIYVLGSTLSLPSRWSPECCPTKEDLTGPAWDAMLGQRSLVFICSPVVNGVSLGARSSPSRCATPQAPVR